MKHLAMLSLACIAIGCKHSEFDVTPDQVSKDTKIKGPGKGAFMDMKHLPPGSVVNTLKYKKGDQLPDGRIADKDVEFKRVEFKGDAPGGKHMMTEDVVAK